MSIHETAIVEEGAEIHPSAEIGPYCRIGPKVKVDEGTKLLSHVVIDGRTTLGKDNLVHPFSVLGGPPQDLKYAGEDTKLTIGCRREKRI